MQDTLEHLLVYYSDATYVIYNVQQGVGARMQNTTSFRFILRVKLKDTGGATC
jgi:hypothetical protein